ncbi:hypothetical protein KCMC57_up02760 [Kitasatospora sp. CMC57]|uniref:Beta-ketoacyl synthase N-terminal domain-containing protein n=1 Tax=Kitasatospora sp. CMC57 TaxID=3231513 RepID=A0AB33JRG7_9ACTN
MSVLRVLAQGRWPEPGDTALPRLPGFTDSPFNPLIVAAAERCLRTWDRELPGRTGLLLTSASGDLGTARAIGAAAAGHRRVPPLLFFQSNPNAVLGHLAARWNLTGPVVATSPPIVPVPGEVPPDALELASLLLADGDADQLLLIAAEQADPADPGQAVAVLLTA